MIGAGNIGRGFIGMLLERSGYHVVFADANDTVVRELSANGRYTVHMVDDECVDTVVENLSAVNSTKQGFSDIIAESELICTAVGLSVLPRIAPTIAEGIAKRRANGVTEPMNIIACENAFRATSQLKELVATHVDAETLAYMDEYVGFPDCAVDRIVPRANNTSVSAVTVERYHEWDVEKSSVKGTPPVIEGLTYVERLDAYLERKLFILNGSHAVIAFYGHLKGYETVGEALRDGEIATLVRALMAECSAMLVKRRGFAAQELADYADTVLHRFANPYIVDDVKRIAREPLRKLSPDDRLVAPMKYAQGYGIDTPSYCTGIALALLYDESEDAQSQELRKKLAADGIDAVLSEVCHLTADDPATAKIKEKYACLQSLKKGSH